MLYVHTSLDDVISFRGDNCFIMKTNVFQVLQQNPSDRIWPNFELYVLIKWWPWPWLRSHGNLLGKHGDWNSSKSSLCIGLKLGRYITGITCSMYIPVSMTSISFRGDNCFLMKILGFSLAPSSLLNPFHRFARKFRQLLRQIWCSFRTIEKVTLNSA